MKQKFPKTYQDICLYSEVCHTLANYNYRLPSRRFIQELFQDVNFEQVWFWAIKEIFTESILVILWK